MKKAIMFIIAALVLGQSLYSAEIVRFSRKIKPGFFDDQFSAKYYLVDSNGEKNYGYFLYGESSRDISGYERETSYGVADYTVAPYYGLAYMTDVLEFAMKMENFYTFGLVFAIGMGCGGLTFPGIVGLYYGDQSGTQTQRNYYYLGVAGVALGATCFATGFFFGIASLIARVRAEKYRKRILDRLNGVSAAIDDEEKVKFSVLLNENHSGLKLGCILSF